MNMEYSKQVIEEKERKIKLIEEFYEKYERLPKQREKYQEAAIGVFLNHIRCENTHITEEQMQRLVVLGFGKQVKNREKEYKIRLIEEFYEKYKRLPKQKEKYIEVAIGRFLSDIKTGTTSVTEEQMERLVVLGFGEQTREKEKEEKIKLVEKFYRENKRLPKKSETHQGVALGQFLNNIKSGNTGITEEQMERLVALGLKDREEEKEEKVELVEEFYRKNKRLPKRNEKYKGVALGQFLNNIKSRGTSITEEQMKRLKKLGFQDQSDDVRIGTSIQKIGEFHQKNNRLPEPGESLKNEKTKVGDMLLSIRIGKIRITERQFLCLQEMGARLIREQVKLFERPHVYVKK